MSTVYVDELFLLELLADYFLLLGTAKVCALPYRRGRFLLGAALGALWSCLSLLPGMAWASAPVMRLALAAAMTVAAFGGERHLGRCFASFLGVSALFGGAVYAVSLLRGGAAGLCWDGLVHGGLCRGAPGGGEGRKRRLREG